MKPHNLGNRFRQKRMSRFLELVQSTSAARLRILDIGGTAAYWHALPGLYGRDDVEITIVNLDQAEIDDANLRIRSGNACSLPFDDMAFDFVHSNSVIEHVGGVEQMKEMAREVRRLAPRYFVQTPNRWFPVEPHYKLPLVQFLPRSVRLPLMATIGRGFKDYIELIGPGEMRELFPDATIERERFLGLTKSLIAVKS